MFTHALSPPFLVGFAGIQQHARRVLCALALLLHPRGAWPITLRSALTAAKLVAPMSEVALVTELAEAVLLVIFAHAGFEVGCTAGAAAALAVAIRSGCH